MSQKFQCGENTALVGYVYDECEALERAAIEAHVAICAACAAELAALQSTHTALSSWTPPEVDLGFQIVRPTAPVFESPKSEFPKHVGTMNRPWYGRSVPVWAQAVAATFIFVTGLSLGVARGIMPTAAAPVGVPASEVGSAVSATDLVALERRLRAEMARIQPASASVRDVTAPAASASDEQLLARVRTLIEESERRQQRELALRTAQVMRDVDSQRRVDLAQIQSSFGQIEGLTGAEVREQRQMLNYLIRASEQR
jgi:anti-sigma factor RsiW